jgi:hypothetical protein
MIGKVVAGTPGRLFFDIDFGNETAFPFGEILHLAGMEKPFVAALSGLLTICSIDISV